MHAIIRHCLTFSDKDVDKGVPKSRLWIDVWGTRNVSGFTLNNCNYPSPKEFLEDKKEEYRSLISLTLDQDLKTVSALGPSLSLYPHLTELTIFFPPCNRPEELGAFIGFLEAIKDQMVKICLEFNSKHLGEENYKQDDHMSAILKKFSQFSKLRVLLLKNFYLCNVQNFLLPSTLEVFELSGKGLWFGAIHTFVFANQPQLKLHSFKLHFSFPEHKGHSGYPDFFITRQIDNMMVLFSPKKVDLDIKFGPKNTFPFLQGHESLLLPDLKSFSCVVTPDQYVLKNFFTHHGNKIVNLHFNLCNTTAKNLIPLIKPSLDVLKPMKKLHTLSFSGPSSEAAIHTLILFFLRHMIGVKELIVPLPEWKETKYDGKEEVENEKSNAFIERAESIKNKIKKQNVDLFYRVPLFSPLRVHDMFYRMGEIYQYLARHITHAVIIPIIIEYMLPKLDRDFCPEFLLEPVMWRLRGWSREKNWKRNNEREDWEIFKLFAALNGKRKQAKSNEETMQDEHHGDGVEEEPPQKKLKSKKPNLFKRVKSKAGSSSSSAIKNKININR